MKTAAITDESYQLLIAAEDRLLAVRDGQRLQLIGWGAGPLFEVTGQLAMDLAQVLLENRQDGALRRRLEAALEAVQGPASARTALDRAFSACFRPASVGDLLRRDGYSQLWIELLARCNQSCVHCYADAGTERNESLEQRTVERILADAAELDFQQVQFTGGDPLLCPFLIEAVERAGELGFEVEVFTNGLELSSLLLEALRARDVALAFSLYADTAKVHDRITGLSGSWDRTVDAINRARVVGSRLRTAVVIMSENGEVAEATVRFARGLVGADAVRVDLARSVGRGRFDPTLGLPEAAHRQASDRTRLGKACVGADGRVFPCILARWITLGCIDEHRGLKQILLDPVPRTSWKIFGECSEQLTCPECQITASIFDRIARRWDREDAAA